MHFWLRTRIQIWFKCWIIYCLWSSSTISRCRFLLIWIWIKLAFLSILILLPCQFNSQKYKFNVIQDSSKSKQLKPLVCVQNISFGVISIFVCLLLMIWSLLNVFVVVKYVCLYVDCSTVCVLSTFNFTTFFAVNKF